MTGSTISGHSERSDHRVADENASVHLGGDDDADIPYRPSPEETARLLNEYLAVAPSNSGLTLMWRGLPRSWMEEHLVIALAQMGCHDDAEYVYLPPLPRPHRGPKGSPLAQKNHKYRYAFVHFATVEGAVYFMQRVEAFAAGELGPLLGEKVADMWTCAADLQGLSNNLVNITASPGHKQRRMAGYLRLDGKFTAIPKVPRRRIGFPHGDALRRRINTC